MDGGARNTGFEAIATLLGVQRVDPVVLERFMQIPPAYFCAESAARVTNNHHGFLPARIGACPNQQAYDRGIRHLVHDRTKIDGNRAIVFPD